MKKVSVIVPVYNVELFLEKCLNSLVNQTLQEIEILVINDGSTDNSQKIIENFEKKYPEKIKSFQKENGGLSDARNFGLKNATAEFIGFVDSDDFVTPTMFEQMYHLSQKHNAEIVICNLQKINEKGEITQKLTQIPHLEEKIILEENFSVFSDLSYFACNKIFKKELFENQEFKKGIHFEDIELIPKLLLSCKTIAQTQNYHYQYFERSNSISKTHTEKGLDILNAVKSIENFIKKTKFKDNKKEIKNFIIMQGFYSFLAYLAFVKDDLIHQKMLNELKNFIKERKISKWEILSYKRFNKNYFLSLPIKKKIYYALFLLNQHQLIRKILK